MGYMESPFLYFLKPSFIINQYHQGIGIGQQHYVKVSQKFMRLCLVVYKYTSGQTGQNFLCKVFSVTF